MRVDTVLQRHLRIWHLALKAAGLVCHTGCGLSIRDIKAHPYQWPLPPIIPHLLQKGQPPNSATPYGPMGPIFSQASQEGKESWREVLCQETSPGPMSSLSTHYLWPDWCLNGVRSRTPTHGLALALPPLLSLYRCLLKTMAVMAIHFWVLLRIMLFVYS